MEIHNLTQKNMEELEAKVKELKIKNPEIESKFFEQQVDPFKYETSQKLAYIMNKLDRLYDLMHDYTLAHN